MSGADRQGPGVGRAQRRQERPGAQPHGERSEEERAGQRTRPPPPRRVDHGLPVVGSSPRSGAEHLFSGHTGPTPTRFTSDGAGQAATAASTRSTSALVADQVGSDGAPALRRRAQVRPQPGVAEPLLHRPGERAGVVGRHEDAGAPPAGCPADRLRQAADPRRQHRDAVGERLGDRHPVGLAPRRGDEEVGAGVRGIQLGPAQRAGEPHPVRDPQLDGPRRAAARRSPGRVRASRRRCRRQRGVADPGERLDQHVVPLGRDHRPDAQQPAPGRVARGRGCRRRHPERRRRPATGRGRRRRAASAGSSGSSSPPRRRTAAPQPPAPAPRRCRRRARPGPAAGARARRAAADRPRRRRTSGWSDATRPSSSTVAPVGRPRQHPDRADAVNTACPQRFSAGTGILVHVPPERRQPGAEPPVVGVAATRPGRVVDPVRYDHVHQASQVALVGGPGDVRLTQGDDERRQLGGIPAEVARVRCARRAGRPRPGPAARSWC